jgi:hypothetical protein
MGGAGKDIAGIQNYQTALFPPLDGIVCLLQVPRVSRLHQMPCLRAVRFPPGEQEPSVFENVILAALMKTSRAVVDRLLDASNPSLTISTLGKAAAPWAVKSK